MKETCAIRFLFHIQQCFINMGPCNLKGTELCNNFLGQVSVDTLWQ